MSILYDLLYGLALLIGWPVLLYRRLRRGPGSLSLGKRLGGVPSRPVAADCVWIHGVSLGEINATVTLVEELHRRDPDLALVVSSTTGTGLTRARQLYPKLTVFRFPLDFSLIVGRTLSRIRPSVIVLMELEVWPNLIEVATARGVRVVIANGRVTEDRTMRAFRRWPLRHVARRMFSKLAWIGAQDETYARRFVELGAQPDRVQVTGSMKYDAAEVGDWIEGQEELARAMGIDRHKPLWVCGSTGPGEEALILDAYQRIVAATPGLQLAIIPRKPERFDEAAALIVRRGFACLRRSTGAPTLPSGASEPLPVFLGDTMGELRKFYGLATVTFVGRSLVPLGGSDVMEAAGLARPLVFGPHMENFAEATELLLREQGAIQVQSGDELTAAVKALLSDGERARRIGEAGRRTIIARRGATQRTAEQVLALIGRR